MLAHNSRMKSMSGLLNIGHTCYMNATIQATRCLKDFVEIVGSGEHSDDSLHTCLCKIVETMNESCSTIRPTTFVRNIVSKRFPLHKPADAHEFLCFLLDRLHEESKMKVGMTIVARVPDIHTKRENQALMAYQAMFQDGFSNVIPTFFGQMCTSLKAKKGQYKKEMFETFSTLNVPVRKSLYQSLDDYFASEELNGENQVMDDTTNTLVDATKQTYLWRNPRILIVVLNRFGEQKNTEAIDIPELLDVFRYRYPPSNNNLYHLRSICNHVGDSNNGHYYTTAKWNRNWYSFDDTVVKHCDGWGDGSEAYLLFYELASKINMVV